MKEIFNLSNTKVFLFYFLLFLLIYGLSNKLNILDYDLWARLVQGKHVVQTGSVMYKDILSFVPTHTWYDPEWLSSAFFYLIIEKFGIISITITKILLIFSSLVLITVGAHIVSNSKYSNLHLEYFTIILFTFFIGGSSGIYLRCQSFSYLLLPILICLLELISKNYENKKSLLYLATIPFLMLFWLNVHGGCIAGTGIFVLYIIGRILNKKPVKKYLYSLLPTFLVFFINPWGYKYIWFLLHSMTLDRSWIIEWQPLVGYDLLYDSVIVAILVFLLLICVARLIIEKFKNINYSKLIILIVTYYLSWAHYKHVPLFAICAGIYMYDDYLFIFRKISDCIRKKINFNEVCQRYTILLKDILVYIVVFGVSIFMIITAPISTSIVEKSIQTYPINMIEFLNKNNIKGNLFLPYYYASYAAYKTHPNIKIFMDGRQEQVWDYEIFDRTMFFMYQILKPNMKPIVEEYEPDIFLLEEGWNYGDYVKNKPEKYVEIFSDGVNSLYIKINLAKSSYSMPETDRYDFNNMLDTKIDFKRKK